MALPAGTKSRAVYRVNEKIAVFESEFEFKDLRRMPSTGNYQVQRVLSN